MPPWTASRGTFWSLSLTGRGSHELDQKAQKAGAISGAGPDISGLVVAAESIYSRAMGSPAGERHHIVDDLLTQYGGLKGMSQEEVVSLLGPDTDGDQREERLTPGRPGGAGAFGLSHRELRVGMGLPVPLSGGRDRDGEQDLCGLRPEKARLDLWGKEGFKTGWKENLEAI